MPNVSGISRNALKVSEVSVDKVLSHYLWNAAIPPKKEDMLTAATSPNEKPIHIDATDYMRNGAGRYASAADFKMFETFLMLKIYLLEISLTLLMKLSI